MGVLTRIWGWFRKRRVVAGNVYFNYDYSDQFYDELFNDLRSHVLNVQPFTKLRKAYSVRLLRLIEEERDRFSKEIPRFKELEKPRWNSVDFGHFYETKVLVRKPSSGSVLEKSSLVGIARSGAAFEQYFSNVEHIFFPNLFFFLVDLRKVVSESEVVEKVLSDYGPFLVKLKIESILRADLERHSLEVSGEVE